MKFSSRPRISRFAPAYTLVLISVAGANPASASSVELISGPDGALNGFVDRSLERNPVLFGRITDPDPTGLQTGFTANTAFSDVASTQTQTSSVIADSRSFVIDYSASFSGEEFIGQGSFAEAETFDLLIEQLEPQRGTFVGPTTFPSEGNFFFGDFINGDPDTSINATYRFEVNEAIDFELDFGASGEDRFRSIFSLSEIDPAGSDARTVFEIDLDGGNDSPISTFRLGGGEVGLLNRNSLRPVGFDENLQSLIDQTEEVFFVAPFNFAGGSVVGQIQPGLYEIALDGRPGFDTRQLSLGHDFTFTATATSSAVAVPTPTAAFVGLTLLGGLAIRRRR